MDMADACDTTPLLWTDGGKVHFFWGLPRAVGGFPFQWTTSSDSGATWCEVQFPRFTSSIGPHRRQPITSALRDSQGAIYVASDGIGASSVLWVSKDGMKTWQNPGGRHTTCALLANGKTILGMGGKNSHIDGYMPQSVSADGGKTWQVSKTRSPPWAQASARACCGLPAAGFSSVETSSAPPSLFILRTIAHSRRGLTNTALLWRCRKTRAVRGASRSSSARNHTRPHPGTVRLIRSATP